MTYRLIIGTDPAGGRRVEVSAPELLIGRDFDADLVIETPMVSRRHARIYSDGGAYFIEDLGSRNGTYVNGDIILGPARLSSGDSIAISQGAPLTFEIVDEGEITSPPSSAELNETALDGTLAAVPESLVSPDLIVAIGGEAAGTHRLAGDVITLGRSSDCDIVLNSALVSRHHARLERAGRGYQIVPLPEARNPILLRGQVVSIPTRLHHGDELQIGEIDLDVAVTLTYHAPAEVPANKPTLAAPLKPLSIEIDQDQRKEDFEKLADRTFFRVLKERSRELRQQQE